MPTEVLSEGHDFTAARKPPKNYLLLEMFVEAALWINTDDIISKVYETEMESERSLGIEMFHAEYAKEGLSGWLLTVDTIGHQILGEILQCVCLQQWICSCTMMSCSCCS